MEVPGSMTAYAIVSQPKGQKLLAEIFLDHQIVSLTAEFIVEMIGPDKLAPVVQDHWSRIGDLPSFRSDEVEVIFGRAFGAPFEVVELGDFELGGVEVLCRVRTGRASVESTIIYWVKDGFQWNLFFLHLGQA